MEGKKLNFHHKNKKDKEYIDVHVFAETHILIHVCMCTCECVRKNTQKTRKGILTSGYRSGRRENDKATINKGKHRRQEIVCNKRSQCSQLPVLFLNITSCFRERCLGSFPLRRSKGNLTLKFDHLPGQRGKLCIRAKSPNHFGLGGN